MSTSTSTSRAGRSSRDVREVEGVFDVVDKAWRSMPAADRIVLLGHDRKSLTTSEKAVLLNRLAKPSRAGSARRRR